MGVFCLHPKCQYWSGEKHNFTGYGCTFDWEKYRSDRKKKIFNPHPCEEHHAQEEAIAKRWR